MSSEGKINTETQTPEKQPEEKHRQNSYIPETSEEQGTRKIEQEQEQTNESHDHEKKKGPRESRKACSHSTLPPIHKLLNCSAQNKLTLQYELETAFLQKFQEVKAKRGKAILLVTDIEHEDLFSHQ